MKNNNIYDKAMEINEKIYKKIEEYQNGTNFTIYEFDELHELFNKLNEIEEEEQKSLIYELNEDYEER